MLKFTVSSAKHRTGLVQLASSSKHTQQPLTIDSNPFVCVDYVCVAVPQVVLVSQAGVKMIEGRGKIVDAHTVSVNGRNYTVSLYSLTNFARIPDIVLYLDAVLSPCPH